MLIYLSYLKAFRNYADSVLDESTAFIQIGSYANLLTQKANQLVCRATLNKNINIANLQKDMFETGGVYIKKFSEKFRKEKPIETRLYAKRAPVVSAQYAYTRA